LFWFLVARLTFVFSGPHTTTSSSSSSSCFLLLASSSSSSKLEVNAINTTLELILPKPYINGGVLF